jgi:hypothetical protein
MARARSAWKAIGAQSAAMRFSRGTVGALRYEWLDDADTVVATEEYERGKGLNRFVDKRALLQVGPKSYEMRRSPGGEHRAFSYCDSDPRLGCNGTTSPASQR